MRQFLRPSKLVLTSSWMVLVLIPAVGLCLGVSCIDWPAPQESKPLFNSHVVDPGRVYRSAQPDPGGLRVAIADLGLRTVLNLRGEHPGVGWYDAEKAVCDEMGVTHVSYPMSARSLPPADMLGQALNTLRTAEYPMLIHCQGGADRTGAIAAIYRIAILGDDKVVAAAEELTPARLHFRAFAPCMDTLIEMFESTPQWLADYAAAVDQTPCAP